MFMTTRQEKISIACNFILGLIRDRRTESGLYKTAITRFRKLLDDEINNAEPLVETVAQVQDIFGVK